MATQIPKDEPPAVTAAAPIKTFQTDSLAVHVYANQADLASAAASDAQKYLKDVIAKRGSARVSLATGNSQMQFLDKLIRLGGVDWSGVTLFHMDEYLGISADHKASFRRYMRERVESRIRPKVFHYLEGDAAQPIDECERYAALLREQPIDLCCLGIGENGHLAFNDPPVADFADKRVVKIVLLDLACRQQQVSEGHFADIPAVPQYALTLTIPTLCSARKMICIAPEKRKAQAVKDALQRPIHTACPASFLRKQPHATLLLDLDSASLL
jgi:glucosamine-6-phosphate deaminase